jgi:hypothetical protein
MFSLFTFDAPSIPDASGRFQRFQDVRRDGIYAGLFPHDAL